MKENRAARLRRPGADGGQMGRVCRSSFVVHHESLWMPDAHASAFERETQRPGRAPLRVAPTPLVSAVQQKIPETELSKIPFLGPLYPTSDPNAVGACRRPALPGLIVYKFKTTLESELQRKIRETGSSKYSFLRRLDQTFDRNGVGACRRPARPGLRFLYVPRNPPGGFPPAARD